MDDIHSILAALERSKQSCVLAFVVKVEGSAYRKAGACMLLEKDGHATGLLSAGCLEEDLAERSKELFGSGQARMMRYEPGR